MTLHFPLCATQHSTDVVLLLGRNFEITSKFNELRFPLACGVGGGLVIRPGCESADQRVSVGKFPEVLEVAQVLRNIAKILTSCKKH